MNRRAFLLGPVLALAMLPSNVVAAAMPLLLSDWHADNTQGGVVFAAYQIGYVVSVLVLLPLTDRVRAGRVIALCALATGLSFLLFPFFAFSVWSASLLRFCAGLGLAGIYMPGVRIIAAAASPQRRGFAVGAYVSAFYLGSALSLWASGVLLPGFGWRGAATILGALSFAALPLAILSTRGMSAPTQGRARLDLSVLRDPPVARNVLAYTGHSWELYVSRGWLATFVASALITQGFDNTRASADGSQWAALMAGFGTPGVFLGGWLSDHLGRARAAVLMTLLSGTTSLVFGFMGGAPWAMLLGVGCAYGLLVSADSAIYSTSITELAPPLR
ncbi:MAG: MFS transporter, partial [Chloroflexi bacterium]|nr:MFS transporter [Chloroflexota bacterium]